MLSIEEIDVLRQELNKRLGKILLSTHAVVDAEYIRLCAEIDKLRGRERRQHLVPDLRKMKKKIEIELDLNAIEILWALRRIQEQRYGRCLACGANIPFEELQINPTESLCGPCRVQQEVLIRN